MVFEQNEVGIDNKKALVHANRWDVYMREKMSLSNVGYYVKVSDSDGNNIIFEVVDDHVVQEPNQNDEIELWGFDF